ncbi:transglutaminase domain-containing protein [Sunxiuqinia indica]|uniref:transglutaminase domain-containing protein n=1 Tax=Sunxiuqinia indica TaxID=2692584 RepID=UPI0013578161|nr:transglutaminase domain-containing protein [Sunxiuqinia indica]
MKKKHKIPFHGIVPVYLIIFIGCTISPNLKYPPAVEANLKNAGINRPELEKAISYFKQSGDSLKLKAAYFLIANMDIHHSETYYWKDRDGKRVPFNEFDYPDFPSAVAAMDSIKKIKGGLTFKDTILEDLTSLSGQFLINNINLAVDHWRISKFKDIPFRDFCEYVLPYRVTTEPVQDWRKDYYNRYRWLTDSLENKPLKQVLIYAALDYRRWFDFNIGRETRNEPLPRLDAKQLLFRKKGACEDVASLQVFTLRSQSIPVSYNMVAFWGTSYGRHFMNTVFDQKMNPIEYDATKNEITGGRLDREPAKVVRYTYSRQPDALASINEPRDIPPCYLQKPNIVDVTPTYWECSDLALPLFPQQKVPEDHAEKTDKKGEPIPVVYACMFSMGRWQVAWWGKALNDTVSFPNMSDGTVILPMYYRKKRLVPAGYPFANGYNRKLLLKPDTMGNRSIIIEEQDRYLKFRPGKKYCLYYWDTKWKLIAEKTASVSTPRLTFDEVPLHALLRLVPEYSQGKERPFIITEDGTRFWW